MKDLILNVPDSSTACLITNLTYQLLVNDADKVYHLNNNQRKLPDPYSLSYKKINKGTILYKELEKYLKKHKLGKIVDARLNIFSESDMISDHTDTAYPDCYTTLITIENPFRSYFKHGELEYNANSFGPAYITMKPGTIHGVKTGNNRRISIVVWSK
jgi:hypothetical protein